MKPLSFSRCYSFSKMAFSRKSKCDGDAHTAILSTLLTFLLSLLITHSSVRVRKLTQNTLREKKRHASLFPFPNPLSLPPPFQKTFARERKKSKRNLLFPLLPPKFITPPPNSPSRAALPQPGNKNSVFSCTAFFKPRGVWHGCMRYNTTMMHE